MRNTHLLAWCLLGESATNLLTICVMWYSSLRFNILVNQKVRTDMILSDFKQKSQNCYCALNKDGFCTNISTLVGQRGRDGDSCVVFLPHVSWSTFPTKQWQRWKEGSSTPSSHKSIHDWMLFYFTVYGCIINQFQFGILIGTINIHTEMMRNSVSHLCSGKKKVVLILLKVATVP